MLEEVQGCPAKTAISANSLRFLQKFRKIREISIFLLRANQDISGRDILIFTRAVFLAFVFRKQETWRKGTIKKFKCGPRLKEESCNDVWLVYKIPPAATIYDVVCWRNRTGLRNLHAMFVREKLKTLQFADSRIGYKRTMVAGKELLNFEDLQESCN